MIHANKLKQPEQQQQRNTDLSFVAIVGSFLRLWRFNTGLSFVAVCVSVLQNKYPRPKVGLRS